MKMVTYGPDLPVWQLLDPMMTAEGLGFIPTFLRVSDERPAQVQLDERYEQLAGCGWRKARAAFTLSPHGLRAPEDPMFRVLAQTKLRDETIRLYEGSWVAIIQPDDSFEVARMD